MSTKEFHRTSQDHAGVNAGTKFKMIKSHHEVQGELIAGVDLTLDSIAHYPTRFRLKDDAGRIWTVPIHSVEKLSE
ncbi:MAG: hypothetical protein HOA15_08430 [Candidatus Marinimicrobia bacterium]|jgi:hypothetical protein|nr:hypothetical protein [Candidatus Neomarinimicrobiota bacterium]